MNNLSTNPQHILALAYTPIAFRDPLALTLSLDSYFSEMAMRQQEPVLKQLRFAWWREQLGKKPLERAGRDPILIALSELQTARPELCLDEYSLLIVDAWTEIVSSDPDREPLAIEKSAELRSEAIFLSYAKWVGSFENNRDKIFLLGKEWALYGIGPRSFRSQPHLPRSLKPLNILYMAAALGCEMPARHRIGAAMRMHFYALTGL